MPETREVSESREPEITPVILQDSDNAKFWYVTGIILFGVAMICAVGIFVDAILIFRGKISFPESVLWVIVAVSISFVVVASQNYQRVIFDGHGVTTQTIPRVSGAVSSHHYPWCQVVTVRWVSTESEESIDHSVELDIGSGKPVVVLAYESMFVDIESERKKLECGLQQLPGGNGKFVTITV